MTDLGAAIEAGAQALSEKHRLKAGGECVRYARTAIEAALPALLAAGWIPPEGEKT